MSETLLPCPSCDYTARLYWPWHADTSVEGYGFVGCENDSCSMQGPERHSKQQCIDLWNALPRRAPASPVTQELREALEVLRGVSHRIRLSDTEEQLEALADDIDVFLVELAKHKPSPAAEEK